MKPLHFKGRLPGSKSLLNRLLILQSYSHGLRIEGDSKADDVAKMKSALADILHGREADCGAAGTVLRFLAVRASRIPGRHVLCGRARLMERPQQELTRLLSQLGCRAEIEGERMIISGEGWILPGTAITVDRSFSSQFASAVLLNAWDLPGPLSLAWQGSVVSEPYLRMTIRLVQSAGMALTESSRGISIAPRSQVAASVMEAEMDLSSAFSVAAVAVASGGSARFENWPKDSSQSDAVFPGLLERMGCAVSRDGDVRIVAPSDRRFLSIDADLKGAPDLFPVLAALCALAEGDSRLFGAPHLSHKESDRIAQIARLLRLANVDNMPLPDGIAIHGSANRRSIESAAFDPADDHRIAMAAQVLNAAGARIDITDPSVVNKSFPEFWAITGQ